MQDSGVKNGWGQTLAQLETANRILAGVDPADAESFRTALDLRALAIEFLDQRGFSDCPPEVIAALKPALEVGQYAEVRLRSHRNRLTQEWSQWHHLEQELRSRLRSDDCQVEVRL
jgi:7-cyano-7-deazaguanine synthase in queuosine biosynthesis